jgi:hypothetical protein
MTSHIDRRIRKATATATVVVALCSAVLSYAGLRDLAVDAGFSDALSLLLPIAVDGTVLAGMLGVMHAAITKTGAIYPWSLVLLGLGVSVWGNASTATSLSDKFVHAIAPVAMALSLEALTASLRRRIVDEQIAEQAASAIQAAAEARQRRAERAASNPVAAKRKPSDNSTSRVKATPELHAQVLDLKGEGLSYRQIESRLGISKSTISRMLTAA